MKNISQIVDQIVDTDDISNPQAIKFDIQVRTCGGGLPPFWFMPLKDGRNVSPSQKKATRSSRRSGETS